MLEAEREPKLKEGQVLSKRYRIERLLAFGGMSEVYTAYDPELDRPVVVKVLLEMDTDGDEEIERFQRQAPAAARIRHPGIVETYDRGTDGDIHFIVMERLEGQDLSKRIAEQHKLDVGFVVRVGVELSRASRAAHKKGVIHRDLKPSNVFLAVSGDRRDVVKVLDFGVAKIVDAQVLTKTGQMIGTLPYMAPEQLENAKYVDERADIYSIGCILYEMLAGRPAFAADSSVGLVMKIIKEHPVTLIRFRADVPSELDAIIQCAMAKDRRDRFISADALADALSRIALDLGVSIPPPSISPPLNQEEDQQTPVVTSFTSDKPPANPLWNQDTLYSTQGLQKNDGYPYSSTTSNSELGIAQTLPGESMQDRDSDTHEIKPPQVGAGGSRQLIKQKPSFLLFIATTVLLLAMAGLALLFW